MKKEIELFNEILSLRNRLKAIQQLSWELAQLDKNYPLEDVPPASYPELAEAYKSRLEQAKSIILEEEK